MASPVVISNTFAAQSGNVPASELDTNFTQLSGALNSLANFSNYFVDGGSANAIAVTVNSPLVVSYAAGLLLQIKVANANTGATTINVNGLGAVNLVYPSGAAMLSGQLSAGGIISVMHDGTNFQYLGAITTANPVTSGTFTGTLTGMTGTTSGTFNYYISNSNTVTLRVFSNIEGTSNSGFMTLTGVPSAIQPAHQCIVPCVLINNSLGISGFLQPAASATFNLSVGVPSGSFIQPTNGGFTSTGTKGLDATSFCAIYPLQ